MSAKFVVSHLEQQLGPFDEETLIAKWANGEFLPIDYVYDDAKQDWVLMNERFAWAAKPVVQAPPPIAPKKKAPPPPPKEAAKPAPPVVIDELTEADLEIEVPTLNIPAVIAVPMIEASANIPRPEPIITAPPTQKGAQVKMVDGIGVLDLSQPAPGHLELMLDGASELKLEPMHIQVRAAEPETVTWTFDSLSAVGQDVEVTIHAQDSSGAICIHYDDQFVLKIAGAETPREIPVQLHLGIASVKFNHTKAEKWELSLLYMGSRKLKLPTAKHLEWTPGPAVRLILDGPQELIAGAPLKVQVKAVDQYGNLAKTFQGTVSLEVKAS